MCPVELPEPVKARNGASPNSLEPQAICETCHNPLPIDLSARRSGALELLQVPPEEPISRNEGSVHALGGMATQNLVGGLE